MKIYKNIIGYERLFVLCKQTVGRSYTWVSECRAGDRALEVTSKEDALILAKLLKFDIIEFNPDSLHIDHVTGAAQSNDEGLGISAFIVVSDIDAFNDVRTAVLIGETLALNGNVHIWGALEDEIEDVLESAIEKLQTLQCKVKGLIDGEKRLRASKQYQAKSA